MRRKRKNQTEKEIPDNESKKPKKQRFRHLSYEERFKECNDDSDFE